MLGSEADLDDDNNLYGSENVDSYPRYKTGIAGVAYDRTLSDKTFLRVVAGISHTDETLKNDSLVRNDQQVVTTKYLWNEASFQTTKYSLSLTTRTKLNRRNTITSGVTIDMMDVNLYQRDIFANVAKDTVRLDVRDKNVLYQMHSTWKHRFNNHLSLQTGVHAQYYDLNKQWAVEPRMGLQYVPGNGSQVFGLGYGIYNQAQNVTTSYVQTKQGDHNILTNTDLGFTTSQHFVFTYDWNISEKTRLKAEAYYQSLKNVPVEQNPSSFSAINTGISFGPLNQDSLVNNGVGTNYGIELTLDLVFH